VTSGRPAVSNNANVRGIKKTRDRTHAGLVNGNPADRLPNITPAGVVYKVAPASIPNNIKADNGLTRVADSIELGGTLKMNTTIETGRASCRETVYGYVNVDGSENEGRSTESNNAKVGANNTT